MAGGRGGRVGAGPGPAETRGGAGQVSVGSHLLREYPAVQLQEADPEHSECGEKPRRVPAPALPGARGLPASRVQLGVFQASAAAKVDGSPPPACRRLWKTALLPPSQCQGRGSWSDLARSWAPPSSFETRASRLCRPRRAASPVPFRAQAAWPQVSVCTCGGWGRILGTEVQWPG